MTDYDKFKNVTAGIQSLVVSIALAIGGIWTIYTFGLLEDVESVNLVIEAQQIAVPLGNRPAVLVIVTAENNGSRSVTLDLSQEPLLIQKLVTHESGKLVATKTWKPRSYSGFTEKPDVHGFYSGQGVPARSTKKISFYQELEAPGLYFVTFRAPIGDSSKQDRSFNDKQAALRLGVESRGDEWAISTYFSVVEPDRLAAQQAAAPDGRR